MSRRPSSDDAADSEHMQATAAEMVQVLKRLTDVESQCMMALGKIQGRMRALMREQERQRRALPSAAGGGHQPVPQRSLQRADSLQVMEVDDPEIGL